ncbi:MAG: MFS transporter [Proteobacteria bacterium]|nr:MFS transporter [Pseudomonadota bacterium]
MSTMSHDRLRFLFLNLGHAYAHLFMLLYATVVLVLERELGRDYGDLLLPSTAGFVAFAAGTVPAGWLGDRWSKQGMLAVMFLGLGVASLLTALAAGVWQIAAGLAAIGLFASIYHPIGIAMVAEEGTQGTGRGVGRALGVNGVWGNMGVAAAPLLAGTLGTVWGWRAAFAVPGAVALLTGLGFLLLIRHAPPAKERRAPPVARPASRALIRRVFIFVPVASLFGGLVFSAMTVALPKILAEALAAGGGDGLMSGGGGLMSAGTLAAAIFALAAFAQIATGRGVDRMSPRDLMLILAGGQLVLFVLLAQVAGWPVLLLGLLVMSLVFGEIPIHDAMVAHYGAPEWRARIYALKYVLSLGVSSVAVPMIAWLHLAEAPAGNGFVGLYIALAVAAAILVAVSLLLPGRRELAAMVQAAEG